MHLQKILYPCIKAYLLLAQSRSLQSNYDSLYNLNFHFIQMEPLYQKESNETLDTAN